VNIEATIHLTNIARTYAQKGQPAFHALRGIDLAIPARQFVAVLGKSGSGKSTLLNLVAGLDRASEGTLSVCGSALEGKDESALARWRADHVGVVFQFFQLLPTLTAQENVMLAMEYGTRIPKASHAERARALLDRVGVADQAAKLPHTLSGGQQQRVAIARALANDPPVLLADEPTGNLDTETSAEVESLLVALAQEGKTIVAVTHDAALAARANRIVRLADGRIVDDQPNAVAA
jgi:putative ABC transport system ATP-binding protein